MSPGVVSNQIYHRHLQPTECTVHSIHNTMIRHCSQDVLMCLTLIDGKEPALLLVTSVQWIRFQTQPRSVSLGSFKQSLNGLFQVCYARGRIIMSTTAGVNIVQSAAMLRYEWLFSPRSCLSTDEQPAPARRGFVVSLQEDGRRASWGYEDVLLEALLLETNSRKDVTCRYHNFSFCDSMQASSCKGDAQILLTISQYGYHEQT
jgi:hypothetical protein